jgi:hypothetical protein
MTNNHLSPEKCEEVRNLLQQNVTPIQVAQITGCSRAAARYQRRLLVTRGLMAGPDNFPSQRDFRADRLTAENVRQKPGRDFDTLRMPPRQLCLVDGCITGAKIGKFCAVHDPAAIAARVTAGMSEATKRKLMGCRA